MKKGTRENRELAFRLYKEEHGQNIGHVLRRLEQGGLRISARTFYKWKKEDGWDKQTADERQTTLDKKLLDRLLRLIDRYGRQIEGSDRLNDQSTYAYMHLIRAARELSRSMKPERTDPGEMKRLAMEILESDYGIQREEDD